MRSQDHKLAMARSVAEANLASVRSKEEQELASELISKDQVGAVKF
jgi:hypothetical protein